MKYQKIGLGIGFALAFGTAAPALAQQAVQWRVEDGGNGHWYQVKVSNLIGNSWVIARTMAQGLGGDLATFGTLAEWSYVTANVIAGDAAGPNPRTMYIGGRKQGNAWTWVDESPWPANAPWFTPGICPGVPAPNGDGTVLQSFCQGLFWDDRPEVGGGALNKALLEWNADCNGDGVVDYGQILDGTYDDLDANGVPDCCDAGQSCIPCPGDITAGGVVDGTDLAALLSAWGTNGQGKFTTDLNDDGTVDAGDLSIVLAGWGPCPN